MQVLSRLNILLGIVCDVCRVSWVLSLSRWWDGACKHVSKVKMVENLVREEQLSRVRDLGAIYSTREENVGHKVAS